ncbi:MAG TPA: hypothetical protein G4N98_10330 [Thermoflexia bacterium]|nr:hypothetical protein [Thermoflexia bacterium]
MFYKVSYVITGASQPGAILNQKKAPQIGAEIQIGATHCRIVEIKNLLPPQGDCAYLHVTCQALDPAAGE